MKYWLVNSDPYIGQLAFCNPYTTGSIIHMGVSKNSGTPKWMVKIMENPIKMDDLGIPLFLETPI